MAVFEGTIKGRPPHIRSDAMLTFSRLLQHYSKATLLRQACLLFFTLISWPATLRDTYLFATPTQRYNKATDNRVEFETQCLYYIAQITNNRAWSNYYVVNKRVAFFNKTYF